MTSIEQLRAARALLGLSQKQLAEIVGVSTMTIKRAEGTGKPEATTEVMERIRAALENAGVEFIPENGGGAGVRLKSNLG